MYALSIGLAYLSLLIGSLCINTVGGLESYPPIAMSDEITAGVEARQSLALDSPLTWLVPWEMASGYERMAMVPLRLGQVLFGETLGAGRMAHVFFGALTVVGLFGFGRQLIGDIAAYAAAAMLAVSHVHVHLSRAYVCTGIQSAAAMVLVLWILAGLRKPQPAAAWMPRAMLAGLVLGWGVQTYKIAYAFPLLIGFSLFAWRRALPAHWLKIGMAMIVGATPMTFLYVEWLYANYPQSFGHIASLAVANAPDAAQPATASRLALQLRDMATMWWMGKDECSNYGARIPVLDPVTGAAFGLGLLRAVWQWRSPLSVLLIVWLPALMLGAVGLVNNGSCYYRLSSALVWVCLASGWGAAWLLYGVLPRRLAHVLGVGLLGVATYYNLSYTFFQFPAQVADMSGARSILIVSRLCSDRASEADQQAIREPDSSSLRLLLRLQCPDLFERLGLP